MFKILSGLAVMFTIAMIVVAPPATENHPVSPQPAMEIQPIPIPQRQAIPVPPGLPPTFRIQFSDSTGVSVDTVATFVGKSGGYKIPLFDTANPPNFLGYQQSDLDAYFMWRSPPVLHTIDHLNMFTNSFPSPAITRLTHPIELYLPVFSTGCGLRIGTWQAEVWLPWTDRKSFTNYVLPFYPAKLGSIQYFNFSVAP